MNRIIILVFVLALPLISMGQSQFKLNSRTQKAVPISINGNEIIVDSSFINIETNYPAFDTLILLNNPVAIICNFKPDSVYSFWYSCCGSIDIIPTWEMDLIVKNDLEYDENGYQQLTMDQTTFTLKVINNVANDSIYGWYSDHACFPQFKLLTYADWDYGSAQKCFYWNNISDFVFFTSNQTYYEHMNENGVIEDWFPYPNDDEKVIIEKVGSIRVRLFDNDPYAIVYDAQSNKTYLEN
ncbi:MAG: hypothetical protein P8P74_08985 [Crocinitomicaceae bacterium]|nr:hypothetical protein [Crocinitomicaceae bacterium]